MFSPAARVGSDSCSLPIMLFSALWDLVCRDLHKGWTGKEKWSSPCQARPVNHSAEGHGMHAGTM